MDASSGTSVSEPLRFLKLEGNNAALNEKMKFIELIYDRNIIGVAVKYFVTESSQNKIRDLINEYKICTLKLRYIYVHGFGLYEYPNLYVGCKNLTIEGCTGTLIIVELAIKYKNKLGLYQTETIIIDDKMLQSSDFSDRQMTKIGDILENNYTLRLLSIEGEFETDLYEFCNEAQLVILQGRVDKYRLAEKRVQSLIQRNLNGYNRIYAVVVALLGIRKLRRNTIAHVLGRDVVAIICKMVLESKNTVIWI